MAHRAQLRCKWDFLDAAFGESPAAYEQMRIAWSEIGEDVEAEHIALRPGSRPWAWWEFSAPEPRNPDLDEFTQLCRLGVVPRGEQSRFLELKEIYDANHDRKS